MSNERSDSGPRQSFGEGEGPQLLGQMLSSGAEVLGSDGEKVGDLKAVGDAEFTVGRGVKRDLRLPITSVSEVVGDSRITLEFPADRVEEVGWSGGESSNKADDFSESPIREGLGEIFKGRSRERGRDKGK